jgi:hypothetical protein
MGKRTVTDKVRIKGTEDELRDFALAVLEAIDDGKTKVYVDGCPVVIKLIH